MSPTGKLFVHRVLKEWKFQFSVWKTAVDWLVALYLVVPALFIIIKQSFDWWQAPPAWLSFLPFSSAASLLFLFIVLGNIRLFVEEADQLFLLQARSWQKRITTLSLGYSLVMNLMTTFLLFLYLAPIFLLHYRLSWLQLVIWAMFCMLLKSVTGLSKQLVGLRYRGWGERVVRWLLYFFSAMYYRGSVLLLVNYTGWFTLSATILLGILSLLLYLRANWRGSFWQDAAREQTIRLRYASLFLRAASVYTKKSRTVAVNNRPLVFYRSNPLFKQRSASNLLTEACLKSVLRSKSRLFSYLQLIIPCLAIILSIPVRWKWAVWFGMGFMLCKFVELFWRETWNSPWIQLFPWNKEDQSKAAAKGIFVLMLLGFLPLSLAFGLQVYSWAGALALPLGGGILGYYLSKAVASFS